MNAGRGNSLAEEKMLSAINLEEVNLPQSEAELSCCGVR